MSKLPWLRSLVKHNVAARHGSSKPLTSNELWLLELRIESNRILASIPDALWDMCKSSILVIFFYYWQIQHHDGITGTMSPKVYNMYHENLISNRNKTRHVISDMIQDLISGGDQDSGIRLAAASSEQGQGEYNMTWFKIW